MIAGCSKTDCHHTEFDINVVYRVNKNPVYAEGATRTHGYSVFKGKQRDRVVIVQELCKSRGGRPGLSVLTSLLVSVDVKLC